MRLLPDVDVRGISPRLVALLHVVELAHRGATGEELVVTSCRRPPGPRPSRHSPPPSQLVTAADLRRWQLDAAGVAQGFVDELRRYYGEELGVVLEPEELTVAELADRGGLAAVAPHIHVQLKGGTP